MKVDVTLLKADIEYELEKLEKVYNEFLPLKNKLSQSDDVT